LIRSKISECEGVLDSTLNVDEEVMPENENANKMMNIIMDGRVACIPRDDVIYMSDILLSLENRDSSQFDGNYRLANLDDKEYLLPRGVKACVTQKFNEMERRYDYIKKLVGLLKKKKFSFSQEAQNYLALGCHVNSGGSDKASVAIMTCTMRAILIEMGIPESIISNNMITKAFPSRSTVKNMELRLGADCSMLVCYEMAINNVCHISWTVDHGNRRDVDHFVKQISFGSRDESSLTKPVTTTTTTIAQVLLCFMWCFSFWMHSTMPFSMNISNDE
jgi:hypothetical protein